MRWMLLLVFTASVAAVFRTAVTPLANKLGHTERECEQIKNLLEKRDYYSNLLAICENVLNLETYAYIVEQKLKIHKYKSKGKFPVRTSQGKVLVELPNKLTQNEINEYYEQYKSIENDVYSSASVSSQLIVDRQIKCDSKSPESAKCVRKLNCLKIHVISSDHPGELYVLYKGVKVKMDAPPSDWSDPCKEEVKKVYKKLKPLIKLSSKLLKTDMSEITNDKTLKDCAVKTITRTIVGEEVSNGSAREAVKYITKGILGEEAGNAVGAITNNVLNKDADIDINELRANTKVVAEKLMALLAPNLGGFIANTITGRGTPIILNTQHMSTLITFFVNKFRKEENRIEVSKASLKQAIQAAATTILHITIMKERIKMRKFINHDNPYIHTLQVATVDALAAELVDVITNRIMGKDEVIQAKANEKNAKKRKGKPPPKKVQKPIKVYTSMELMNEDEDDI